MLFQTATIQQVGPLSEPQTTQMLDQQPLQQFSGFQQQQQGVNNSGW